MSRTKISIIMGVYNAEATLRRALESIEQQSYSNWELALCDDASTDGTPEILENFRLKHPNTTRIVRNDRNQKLAFSLNRCLEIASGDLIARMDADDIAEPERLEIQENFLRQNPGIDLVGSAIRRFDENGKGDVVRFPARPNPNDLRNGVPFAHATILARRRVFAELGGYVVSPRTRRSQDWDLWFRFFHANMSGANLDAALYNVREDAQAIARRTPKVRFNAWKTTMLGYRMLGFPPRAYVRPTLSLTKSLVPYSAVKLYRKLQYFRYGQKRRRAAKGDVL